MTYYGLVKFQQLLSRYNPLITEAEIKNKYNDETVVNLNSENFRIAFSARGLIDRKTRADPRYVKWYVRLIRDGWDVIRYIPYHRCTMVDIDAFYPIDANY